MNSEDKMVEYLNNLNWPYIQKNEHSVEMFLDSSSFPKLSNDIITLKNDFSFIAYIRYDVLGKTIAVFENIWYYKQFE